MENIIPIVLTIVAFAIIYWLLTFFQHRFFPHTKRQKKESVENTENYSTKSPKKSDFFKKSTEEKILVSQELTNELLKSINSNLRLIVVVFIIIPLVWAIFFD